jgi:hypothetical protein
MAPLNSLFLPNGPKWADPEFFLSLNHLEFNLNKKHFYEKKHHLPFPGAVECGPFLKHGYLPTSQKWADLIFFFILNLKSILSRGHFYVKNFLGPRLP